MKDTHRMFIDGMGVVPRKGIEGGAQIECPLDTLPLNSVANALHVLAGEKPVPTFRKNPAYTSVVPQLQGALLDIARGAKVNIISGIMRSGEGTLSSVYGNYDGEAFMTRKSWSGSRNPRQMSVDFNGEFENRAKNMFSWDTFRAHIGNEEFFKALQIFTEVLQDGGFLSRPILEVLEEVYRKISKDSDLFTKVKEGIVLKTPWSTLILSGRANEMSGLRSGFKKMEPLFNDAVVRGKESVVVRDGEIWVPVTEEEAYLFLKGPGFATILEGGLLNIEECSETWDLSRFENEFVPVYKEGFANVSH